MGKGRIISAHGEGRYTIEIIEDRARAERARAMAVQRVAELDGRISDLEQQINAAQAAVDAAAAEQDAAIEQYRLDMAEAGESDIDLAERAQAVLDAARARDAVRTQQRLLDVQRAAAQSRIDRIDALPPLRQIEAWCADYTEDLAGEVATAEVPGEVGQVIIKPGFEDGAAWSASADGAIQPALAGTPASVFYNLAMMPGWQKWRPTFRIATISNIDNDLCDISLDSATSSQQGLNVNAQGSYSGVPIMYMDCNGDAFEDGDRVLVAFSGNTNQPMVVGFEKEPKECDIYITYRSFLQSSYIHRSLFSDYDEYPPAPSGYMHDRYVYRFSNRTNPAGIYYKMYVYSKKEDVGSIISMQDRDTARSYMSDATREPTGSISRVNNPASKEVAVGNVINKFSYSYLDYNLNGEVVSRSKTISDVGLHAPGSFIEKNYDISYSDISVSNTEILVSYTDAASNSYGMYDSLSGSELRLSESLSSGVGLSISVTLGFSDFPEYLYYKNRRYVPNRFLQFTHDAPSKGKDVYLEYIREDKAGDQP